MIVSEARREANRRNARLSTGPKSEAGKGRSRRNALTHGLSAEVVGLPEEGAAPGAVALDGPGWLAGQVARIMGQIGRCERLEGIYRERAARRAGSCWEDDRRLEAEFLGSGIGRRPGEVARALRLSPQGCDWLIERWALLARAADLGGGWTAEQRSLAFDLLGRPPELRGGDPTEAIDAEGRPTPGAADPASFARRGAADLLRRKGELAPLDALERSGARAEPDAGDDADLRKLRRHEADLHRRLRWCVAQLAVAEAGPGPSTSPAPVPPAPAPAPPPPRPEPVGDHDLGFDPVARFKALMGWAEAGDESPPIPIPIAARPDPRAALEKARRDDRRRKRDGRGG